VRIVSRRREKGQEEIGAVLGPAWSGRRELTVEWRQRNVMPRLTASSETLQVRSTSTTEPP